MLFINLFFVCFLFTQEKDFIEEKESTESNISKLYEQAKVLKTLNDQILNPNPNYDIRPEAEAALNSFIQLESTINTSSIITSEFNTEYLIKLHESIRIVLSLLENYRNAYNINFSILPNHITKKESDFVSKYDLISYNLDIRGMMPSLKFILSVLDYLTSNLKYNFENPHGLLAVDNYFSNGNIYNQSAKLAYYLLMLNHYNFVAKIDLNTFDKYQVINEILSRVLSDTSTNLYTEEPFTTINKLLLISANTKNFDVKSLEYTLTRTLFGTTETLYHVLPTIFNNDFKTICFVPENAENKYGFTLLPNSFNILVPSININDPESVKNLIDLVIEKPRFNIAKNISLSNSISSSKNPKLPQNIRMGWMTPRTGK